MDIEDGYLEKEEEEEEECSYLDITIRLLQFIIVIGFLALFISLVIRDNIY